MRASRPFGDGTATENFPVEICPDPERARVVLAEALVDPNLRNPYILPVPSYDGEGKPDVQPCRMCGKLIEYDCSGRHVRDIFPASVICDRVCFTRYMNYLCDPITRTERRREEEGRRVDADLPVDLGPGVD